MNLDPRISIFLLSIFFVIILATSDIILLLGVIIIFLFWYLTLTSFRLTWRIITILIIPTLFIIALNWLFVSQEFQHVLLMTLRFWGLSWLFNWFLKQVSPDDLAKALWSIHIPYQIAWQISLAYRFLPMFQEESQRIYQSQLSRGIPLDSNLVTKIGNLQSIIIPLFVLTQEKAHLFSEALFARNWNSRSPKTTLNPLKMTKIDKGVFLVGFSFLVIFLIT